MNHERVDDVPVLLAEILRMGLPELLNEHFPTHGNWDGLSLGNTVAIWLTHVLSESNHRLCHVRPWAESLWRTLSGCIGTAFRLENLTDERLAGVLRYLAEPQWAEFEAALNARMLRVYDLSAERVRLDSTTASSYQQVDAEGLFQFGHSKDPRKKLPIIRVMTGLLAGPGLPLVSTVLSGEHAEDPLYIPAMQEVQRGLKRRGLLYVGDSKMGALATRDWVQRQQDFYLCPLGEKQCPVSTLDSYLAPVWAEKQKLETVKWAGLDGKEQTIAEGFTVEVRLTTDQEGKVETWTERRLVIRSLQWAEQRITNLRERVALALAAIDDLGVRRRGKRRYHHLAELEAAVAAILKRHQVEGLLHLDYQEIAPSPPNPAVKVPEPQMPDPAASSAQGAKKPGAWKKPPKVCPSDWKVTAHRQARALAEAERRLGWRVYATNEPAGKLSLAEAAGTYREQYQIEHTHGRLKGHPLSLQPMYLSRDEHVIGLVHLLSLALRVLKIVEYQVRRNLETCAEPLQGIYPGHPRRATRRPSFELLLRALSHITLTTLEHDGKTVRHLTPLTPVQLEILALLQLPSTIYTHLLSRREEPG